MAQPEHLCDIAGHALECGLHLGLCQGFQFAAMLSEPVFELDGAIGVLQAGELLGACQARVTVTGIDLNRVSSKLGVDADPGVVDALIQPVRLPLRFRHRVAGEPGGELDFDIDVAAVVGDVLLPADRVIRGQGAASVLAGDGEAADELLPGGVFLDG